MFDKIVVTEERKRIDHNQCQFKFLYLRGGISMDSVFKWMVSVQSPWEITFLVSQAQWDPPNPNTGQILKTADAIGI